MLQTGSLPIAFTTLDQSSVSATLGKDSLRQGLIAGIIGLILVMIYLLVVYRFLGLVADIALLIYAALFYGLIVLVPITMTLPGIAGIILTIGVAADANVVIFERIKEEVRLGRTVRQAISQGYSKGFHTILDANVCTLITAAVLYIAGHRQRQGLRLHPRRRRDRLDVHRGPRDARHARAARRLPLVPQRRVHGRLRRQGALALRRHGPHEASGSRSRASSS